MFSIVFTFLIEIFLFFLFWMNFMRKTIIYYKKIHKARIELRIAKQNKPKL